MKRNKRMSDTKQIIRDTGHREESSIGVIGIPEREVRENEEGTMAKGCRQPLEAGRGKGRGSALEPPERIRLADSLTID